MEKAESWDEKSVINQLNQGIQLSKKLKKQLHQSSNSREDCGFLVEKIVSCYDNALAVLNFLENGESTHLAASSNVLLSSEVSDHDSKDHVSTDEVHKKRKTLPLWSEEIPVCCETGIEGVPDDGYNWRKYGQKYILGATYPRSYYRCTHRRTRGCLATKQVQRMEDNSSSIFKVVYRGKHSCVPKQTKENINVQTEEESQRLSPEMMIISTESCLKVEPQSTPENIETHFLFEPTSDSYFSMTSPCFLNDHSFLTSESYVGDLEFLIDQTDFYADAAEYFSHFQDLPNNEI